MVLAVWLVGWLCFSVAWVVCVLDFWGLVFMVVAGCGVGLGAGLDLGFLGLSWCCLMILVVLCVGCGVVLVSFLGVLV